MLATGATPVGICDISGNMLTDYNAVSGCNGGTAFMPVDQSPWAVNDDLAYGYAAVNIAGGTEESWCCGCYELTFTSGAVSGKKMIVQATNTGGDLSGNQFDLAIPGGGVGVFNGCTAQWGAPSSGWGAQYGGVSSRANCFDFPTELQAGCLWRFDWFGGSDNPGVTFKQVTCPAALTAKTGCVRAGEVPTGDSPSISDEPASPSSVADDSNTSTAPVIGTIPSVPEPTTTIKSETTTYTTITIYPGKSTSTKKVYSAPPVPTATATQDIEVTPLDSTTLVVYTTGPKTTDGLVVTETVALTTTICPITEADSISSSVVASASIPAIVQSKPATTTHLTTVSQAVQSSNSPKYGSIFSVAPQPSLYSAHASDTTASGSTVTVFADCASTTESSLAVVTTTVYLKC